MTNFSKNQKKNFLLLLDPLLGSDSLAIGIVLNEFISLTMVAMKMGIKHYFNYHRNRYKEEKILHQKHKYFTFDLPQIKLN